MPLAVTLPGTADAQWIASAYGGAFHTRPGEVRVQQPSRGTDVVFPHAGFVSESWTSPIYYGYRLGRRVGGIRWLYLEAELIHGKLYMVDPAHTLGVGVMDGLPAADVPLAEVVESLAMSHGLNLLLANLVVRRQVGPKRLTWSSRVGAGAVVPHAESRVHGKVRGDYQLAGAAMQVSSGIDVALWRGLGLGAEYKWTRARPDVSLADGTASIAADSHHIALGLVAAF
jgi:hypothetical protein